METVKNPHIVVEVTEEVDIGFDTPVVPVLVEQLMTVEELDSSQTYQLLVQATSNTLHIDSPQS